MAGRDRLVLLAAVALIAVTASANPYPAPPGSIVAVGQFGSATTTTAGGKAVLVVPPTGLATCTVNLTGSLQQVTMSHIHLNNSALGNPILIPLMPLFIAQNFSDTRLLNPPVSYSGSFSWVSPFNPATALVVSSSQFLSYLKAGLLFVNVHTVAQPGGATQARLTCRQGSCKP